jgi:glycosyltransferase involved in cell wall biosynthesis
VKRVLMLLANAFRPDPRVEREAALLAGSGFQVDMLSWDRRAELAPEETYRGVKVHRIQNVPSTYGAGWTQIFRTPRFWSEAVKIGLRLKPDIVHCHDLDTLQAGWRLKQRLGCRLIFDAHEDYPSLMSLYLPAPFITGLRFLERRLFRRAEAIITASTLLAERYRQEGAVRVVSIGNYPSLSEFDAAVEKGPTRASLGLAEGQYAAGYIGGFTRNRLLLPLLDAARKLPDTRFLVWGDGHQRQAVEQEAARLANASYLGWLPGSDVPACTRILDAVFYCLKPGYPGAVYNAPNSLANAMAAGRPVVANEVGDLGRIVRQEGCGILLNQVDGSSAAGAFETLRDPALRRRLGEAGRAAAERAYNWETAGAMLLELYHQLSEG